MLKLKLQYFGHLMRRADSLEKTLMLRMIEGRRRRGSQRIRGLDGITDSMDMGLGRLRPLVMNRDSWPAAVHQVAKSWPRLSEWTEYQIKIKVKLNQSCLLVQQFIKWEEIRLLQNVEDIFSEMILI